LARRTKITAVTCKSETMNRFDEKRKTNFDAESARPYTLNPDSGGDRTRPLTRWAEYPRIAIAPVAGRVPSDERFLPMLAASLNVTVSDEKESRPFEAQEGGIVTFMLLLS